MLIKVIGAGVGRTGTRSLQLALQILGFKSYHMFEVVNHHPEHADLWIKKIDGKLSGELFQFLLEVPNDLTFEKERRLIGKTFSKSTMHVLITQLVLFTKNSLRVTPMPKSF